MAKTARELWDEAWPDYNWDEAEPWERRMYLNHAASLRDYGTSKEE